MSEWDFWVSVSMFLFLAWFLFRRLRDTVKPNDNYGLPDLTTQVSKNLSHPVASGSVGNVWKCVRRASDPQEVAVKTIRIDIAGDDSTDRFITVTQRLLRDYHERKQLNHQNLLPLLGISHDFGPLPAMVYPWMHNGSLTTYLEGHFTELTPETQLKILHQVAAALEYLHSKNLVHGNLTANNILMDSTGTAHVADHGILAMYSEFSDSSYIRYNVRWAAPELFHIHESEKDSPCKPASDIYAFGSSDIYAFGSSDIYAFGSIILQVMTGQLPYADIRNDYEVPVTILKGNKPARRPQSPHIDDSLWCFIEKCWSDSAHRPSAVEVSSFLQPER